MSEQNLELVRSIYADWERGDFSVAAWADPEIEFVGYDGPDPGEQTGVAEMAAAWAQTLAAWDDLRAVPSEYRELDRNRVLVFHRWTGRGRTSGLDVSEVFTKAACLFHVSNAKVVRLVCYWDFERALGELELT
jgi:ketosteroid isomerase-like protein